MTYSQKYTLVSFNSPLDINIEFDMVDWPLHVTLADVFAINLTSNLVEKLAELFTVETPVATTTGKNAVLGEAKIVLLDKNDALVGLHDRIVDLLESNGVTFNNPEFTLAGFLPHCTVQNTGRLYSGDTLLIDTISLIDMFPDSNWQRRKVLHNFKLSGIK